MKKAIVVLVSVLLVGLAKDLCACRCEFPNNASEALARAETAFLGKVVSVELQEVKFEIQQVWKGSESPELSLSRDQKGTKCEERFEVGKEYLVFATRSLKRKAKLSTNVCNGNQEKDKASLFLKELGPGKVIQKHVPR